MFLCKPACRLIFELLYLLPLEIVLPMRIDSIGRIRPAFMPGHIVHPRFIAMRLLRGGGERVAEVIKPKFGREMLFESAFEKKERNGKSSFDFVEIGKKGGMERDSAGFGFFPFFLFGGLNGNKAAFVKGEGEHLARAHTRKNQKPKATPPARWLRFFRFPRIRPTVQADNPLTRRKMPLILRALKRSPHFFLFQVLLSSIDLLRFVRLIAFGLNYILFVNRLAIQKNAFLTPLKKFYQKKFQKYLTSAFILDIISVSSTFALDKIPVFKRESLKRGKKLSFVRRARNSSRARLQRETRAERKAKPSRKRERLHSKDKFIKAGKTALMIESGSFCTVEGVKVSAFGFSS